MQPVDYTTLLAICTDLQNNWLPAKVEQIYQCDRHTLSIALRTLKKRGWLTISWHPQAARIHIGNSPPKVPDTFTFSDQLRHQLKGYALTEIKFIAPWERAIDLQFANRPNDPPIWHLYVEIMGKYSNVILTDAENQIITVAHQVSENQSRVRTLQTGQPYEHPPQLGRTLPHLNESQDRWQERIALIPDAIQRQLLQCYGGLSPMVGKSLLNAAKIDPQQTTDKLRNDDWERLFHYWQKWLNCLENKDFKAGYNENGYSVLGWEMTEPVKNLQTLINDYYSDRLNQQAFKQLRHQLNQKISSILKKLRQKADNFRQKLQQSEDCDSYRQQADLLMANLHQWETGLSEITLEDFESGKPIKIKLNPQKNGVQNAQFLYKHHQKLKRAKLAVQPLLNEVLAEIDYLEQVADNLSQIEAYQTLEDLEALEEIKEELIEQKYLDFSQTSQRKSPDFHPYRFSTPSGFELWVGRNNRQNDELTFRIANDYDIWFHTQESAGSHVLLRLKPGTVPEDEDLQCAADWAAYYSRARQSEQVPIVYTRPKYVYKPKGAKPGMVVYKQEQVLWGKPANITAYRKKSN
jgi:predicted ribosome quality control (RQC) complex YloA/Tae2 family protein